jgi:hypothetical protein
LGVAKNYAHKFQQHIIMGHQHLDAQGWDHSGKLGCYCLGGMYDDKKLMYIHKSPRTNPHPTRSCCIVKNGKVKVLRPGDIDWTE